MALLRARRLFRPRVFLLGVCVGLLACALLGRKAANESYYRDFVRVGGPHATDISAFFITASQVRALVHAQCRKDQIVVFVGGDSVLMGAGQPIRYLWTRRLGETLGPGYCVFNLAVPAGWLEGYASLALEIVANDYRGGFLVANTQIPTLNEPDGMRWYKHFFWDAYYKGMLDRSIVTQTEKRMAQIRMGEARATASERARREQTRLGMWLDSYLYFNDLWTCFHYNYFMTVFTPAGGYTPWRPRRTLSDYDYDVDPAEVRTLRHYPPVGSAEDKYGMDVAGAFHPHHFKVTAGGSELVESTLVATEKEIRESTVTEFSGRTLITIVHYSPFYMDRLPPQVKRDYDLVTRRKVELLEKYGYHVVRLDDVGAEDYRDYSHLNTFGGRKLAAQVAAKIKSLPGAQP